MLQDWYFCCCIESRPVQTHTLLAIRETFIDPNSDSIALIVALEELQRMNIWMRVYLLPDVLAAIQQRDELSHGHETVDAYMDNLLALLPADCDKPFRMLSDSMILGATMGNFRKQIIACVNSLMSLPERDLTPTPYFDQKEFLPETLLLIFLENYLHESPAFGQQIADEGDLDAVRRLLDQAIQGDFGRMALRLAIIASSTGTVFDGQKLLDALIGLRDAAPLHEPDLVMLQTTVQYRIAQQSHRGATQRNCQTPATRNMAACRLPGNVSQSLRCL